MFYVAGGKIYSANFNEKTGVYHQVNLVQGQIKVLKGGVAKRPLNREVLSYGELIARYGPTYPSLPVTSKAADS